MVVCELKFHIARGQPNAAVTHGNVQMFISNAKEGDVVESRL